jgi:hypothetical protein
MLFGQSIFQSVLDRLDSEEAEAAPQQTAPSHRIHGLNAGFAVDVRDGVSVSSARADQAYIDNLDLESVFSRPNAADAPSPAAPAPEKVPAPPVIPPHLVRTSAAEVAAELAITSADTLQSLNDKRRSFAKANHPDRIDPLYRDKATIRMKVANLMIDEAIRRIELRARLFG